MNKSGTHHWRNRQLGLRYEFKQPPLFMTMNLWEGKCWCGKSKDQFAPYQRKYCCGHHSFLWFYHIRCYWSQFRYLRIKIDNFTCQMCGNKFENDTKLDVDHIIAITLGGECFDVENVRTLCKECHKKKTAKDMHDKAYDRKGEGIEKLESWL